MEPSHKDAETAAAAAAVAAADPRGASSSSGVVVQVREKKGPLRAAIPYMPFPVAVICLFLNTFVPGLGTFVSAFTVLCGARTDLPDRHVCCVFWLNIAAALIQVLTAIVMVGWIMSIFWGMDMVILASEYRSPWGWGWAGMRRAGWRRGGGQNGLGACDPAGHGCLAGRSAGPAAPRGLTRVLLSNVRGCLDRGPCPHSQLRGL
ncbi:PREDICTED: protein stum homolog isoform X1 [Hipposideros armiger]|uniref:Protein stum homolog isoform X1 n=1 Tax=Hipposideros armiger TaxID=186990 RepID=A0A8B7SMK3_HIPAR|nr:PREDICTED: protein stum homolog isoform X1 [Hipposideros armiger]